ncbi:hypothetical protein IWW42_004672 [Coemansia sp. RSA 1085]|nr:hypothetical protein IWW42_004672 [Coemansia sp. RSA 1085]
MDPLESIVFIEEEYERSGYSEGIAAGKEIGAAEGREMGYEYGYDLGKDVGFYRGWAQEWLRAAAAHPKLVSERAQKKLQAIIDEVDRVPKVNDKNAHYDTRLKDIQLKFKTVSAMLGVNVSAELPTNSLAY